MAAPRRKIVTYGKRANRGHDFFGQLQPEEQNLSVRTPPYTRDTDSEASKATTAEPEDSALFDIPSSDDDTRFPESARKRRRLTPISAAKSQDAVNSRSVGKSPSDSSTANQAQKRNGRGSNHVSAADTSGRSVPKVRPRKAQKTSKRNAPKTLNPSPMRSPSMSSSAPSRSPSQQPLTPPKQRGSTKESLDRDMPSSISMPTPDGTPRYTTKTRDLIETDLAVDSPSKLGLARLQLWSANASPDGSSSDHERKTQDRAIHKAERRHAASRSRLIDALDRSESLTPETSDETGDLTMTVDEVVTEAQPVDDQIRPHHHPKPDVNLKASGLPSSQSLPTAAPRLTYAKQRSYLSETMIDEIPPLPAIGSSQKIQTSVVGHLDSFEMLDVDEDAGVGGIRSIHELRKAGEAVRFQESLDSLFEDITSSTKGRRVLGYCQLGSKMREASFRSQFISHAMDQRLAKLLGTEDNLIDLALQCVLSAQLLHDGQASSRIVQVTASALIPYLNDLLTQHKSVDGLAATRMYNLSKAARRDLVSFSSAILASELWEDTERPTIMTPRLIALRLLDILIRRSKGSDGPRIDIPPSVLDTLVDLLLEINMEGHAEADVLCQLEPLVSILESYTIKTGSLTDDRVQILTKLAGLGPILASLSLPTVQRYRRMQHLVLRLILNITNNNAVLCDALADSALLSAVLQIISNDYVQLAPASGSTTEELESVILSLGAAINLVEVSASARKLIVSLQYKPGEPEISKTQSFVDKLVLLFLSTNDEETDIGALSTTVGEGQNLVAFGYLTVLLSALCAEDEARALIQAKLPGETLQSLRNAMADFLLHFRKVNEENLGGELEGIISKFVEVAERLDQVAAA